MNRTKIEWCDETWEVTQGCTKVSPGCQNCYAERLAQGRLRRFYPDGFGAVRLRHDLIMKPMSWRRPRRIFVCSRSDLFHPGVPLDFIENVWTTMLTESCEQHTFLVLTKRPERMLEFLRRPRTFHISQSLPPLPANIWLGVSVENQETADERIPLLLDTPAALRFVSAEPLLGPVDLPMKWLPGVTIRHDGEVGPRARPRQGLGWVIVGAESGPGARPMDEDWVRSIRDQCASASVPLFYKQKLLNGKKISLPELDGQIWEEFPK